ncbi:hypothetical protein MKK64_17440 [Methylobacterium sp. E-025]|uniref:hypothetical protein n=1 Tax=Methylobacterium sp. E-025 TaxID=2836561 RepID=UPI001FBADBAA|nr:hypothetical protein [Methylobacterium sp. E-025]MCJ2112967.1 hypothetical protein [Methylobacterium sp. E-025]
MIPPAVRATAPAGDPSALRPDEQAPAAAMAPVPTLEGAPPRLAPAPQSVTGLPPSFSFPDPVAPRSAPAPAPRVAARAPAPEADDALAPMTVPLPPQRPLGFGAPSQADMPAVGAVPAQGQAPTGAPTVPEKDGPGIGTILGRLGDAGIGDQMMAFGSGLMSKRGFGAGAAAGFDNMQKASKDRAVTDLAKADLSLKQRKIAQETAALGGNAAIIKRAFPNLSDAEAIAAGSNGGQVASTTWCAPATGSPASRKARSGSSLRPTTSAAPSTCCSRRCRRARTTTRSPRR